MKRIGHLYERIAEPENLREAFLKSVRGKRGKAEVIAYAARLNENLRLLHEQLLARRVDVGHYLFSRCSIWGFVQRAPTLVFSHSGTKVLARRGGSH